MSGLSQEELVEQVLGALKKIDPSNPATDKLASYLYVVDDRLINYVEQLKKSRDLIKDTDETRQERGKLLEQIAFLIFSGLRGISSIKSFQSAGPQHDLVVTGDGETWLTVTKLLYLQTEQRDIIIEAKATKSPLPDKQFARLCNIMHLNLTGAGLGIFLTLKGATGFPKKNEARQRKISDSRLCQVLFHAKTGKFVIVLNEDDISALCENVTLIPTLVRKIRDLFELSGLPTVPSENLKETDLPHHLKILDT